MILTIVPCRIVRYETQEDTSSVRMEVELPNGDLVWKSEYSVQDLNAKLVYHYWKAQGGRCAVTGFTEYRPFKLLDYKGRQWARPRYNALLMHITQCAIYMLYEAPFYTNLKRFFVTLDVEDSFWDVILIQYRQMTKSGESHLALGYRPCQTAETSSWKSSRPALTP